jgi:hypothetical protein
MSGLVHRPIGAVGDALVALDKTRRLYVGLSRDGSSWHAVHPAPVNLVDGNGATIREAGQLVCTCKGSAFRGTCYRVKEAEAFEAGQADAPAWFDDAAPGEITEAMGR